MVRKALASFVGGLVSLGIAALVSTSAYAATKAPAATQETAKKPATHAHAKTLKRGSRHTAAKIEKVSEKRIERGHHAPKPSTEPLPTLAANMTSPLAEPISTQATTRGEKLEKLERSHGAEPMRTPIVVSTHPPSARSSKSKASCMHDAVDILRGAEEEKLPLTKCDGSATPIAIAEMSILVRPGGATKPSAPISELAKGKGSEVAPGIRRIDARLVERLQQVIDHFAKSGVTPKVFVVSGTRPASTGSFHSTGRALDFRIDGVRNEELAAYCKTMPDTGCGYYPNSSFVHIDVRNEGSGKVAWIDASGPGESPNYVAEWPAAKSDAADEDKSADAVKILAKLGSEMPSFAKHPQIDDDSNDAKQAPEDAPAMLEAPIEDAKP